MLSCGEFELYLGSNVWGHTERGVPVAYSAVMPGTRGEGGPSGVFSSNVWGHAERGVPVGVQQ